jgi:hypothetical protein
MAQIALLAILSFVEIIFLVTGKASGGRVFKNSGLMALRTIHCCMGAGQFEGEHIVVKFVMRPGYRSVAVSTALAILTFMLVILQMAGITIRWRTFELMRHGMAFYTLNVDVLANQLEIDQAMVKLDILLPTGRVMAITAGGSKAAIMRVVLEMAALAISRYILQISKSAGIHVAF